MDAQVRHDSRQQRKNTPAASKLAPPRRLDGNTGIGIPTDVQTLPWASGAVTQVYRQAENKVY